MKNLIFRFDVDTHKCLREGVPNLLQVAKKQNVKFTFFINTGASVHRRDIVKRLKKNTNEESFSISAFKKLGIKDTAHILLKNPAIARSHKDVILEIVKDGHEIGLHGGRNHELWGKYADAWSNEKLESEILWGIAELTSISKKINLNGFASPSWNSPKTLPGILKKSGFKYLADIHTDKPMQEIKKKGLVQIPTNISGEPGGVGYVEYCAAKGMNDKEIIKDFKNRLSERNTLASFYDHPYFVGVKKIKLFEDLVRVGIDSGYNIIQMGRIL